MADPPLLSLRFGRIGFGGAPLFDEAEVRLGRGDRACLVGRNGSGKTTLMLALAGLSLLAGTGIAVFHVGVEQGWWPGLTSCAGPGAGASLAETLNQAKAGPAARCDEVPWSLFGISMAGYNALISMAAGLLALWAAARHWRTVK